MRLARVHLLGLALVAPLAVTTSVAQQIHSADSIQLRRTLCMGFCPAYRVTIDRDERIVFVDDSARTMRDIAPVGTFQQLLTALDSARFYALPRSTDGDKDLCRINATDSPSAIVTVFGGSDSSWIDDYHGCFEKNVPPTATDPNAHLVSAPRLDGLRRAERLIDSLTGTACWIRRDPVLQALRRQVYQGQHSDRPCH